MRSGILAGLLLATVSAAAAFAQGAPIKLANVAELSGGGATVGTNWKNGIDLAIEEINAKGGVARPQARSHACGFAIEPRRRARAGAEGARQRTLRPARARLFRIGQGHRAARRRSRHRADHGWRSRRTDAGRQQVPVPHLVRPAILDAEGRQIHQRRAEGEDRSRSSGSTTISAKAAATSSPRNSPSTTSRSPLTSRPKLDRPISPPTSARSRPRRPMRCSSMSTRKRARGCSRS